MELPQSNTLLPVCSYTRTELLSLRTKTSLLSLSTVDRLKDLNIGYHLPRRHRSSRGVKRKKQNLHSFIVASFNAQSVKGNDMACKRCEISKFIKDNGVDLFCVTETWLSAQGDEAKTVELAPRRQAERKWRNTKLAIFKDLYGQAKHKVSILVHTAKCKFYTERIALASSSKELHQIVNTLSNRHPPKILPTIYPSADLPSIFIKHFTNKAEKLRANIASEHVTSTLVTGTTAATFSSFEKVSQLTVNFNSILTISSECILNSAPKSCELESISSKLLIECLDSILPSLTDLFNSSLASGIFPQCFKSALVTPILISDITQMYSDTSACVSTELGPTEWFKTTSGVLQGDTLSPYPFIVLLDYALKKTLQDDVGFVVCKRNGRRHPAIHIGALAYADDICLLPESIDDVECSFNRLESSAAEIGLTINYNKTKVMHLGQTSARHVRFANGDPVDSCDKFEYLGVPTSTAETVFRSRLSKAWAAATKLRSIFNSKANDSIKIGLCRSAVESILLYGLECLPLTLTLQDKLDSAYRRILRLAQTERLIYISSQKEVS